jgi:hypothetical protein
MNGEGAGSPGIQGAKTIFAERGKKYTTAVIQFVHFIARAHGRIWRRQEIEADLPTHNKVL